MSFLFLILAIAINPIKAFSPTLVVIIYGLTFFSSNFGPNTVTFLLPAATFPSAARSTLNGISAASGKVGATIGSSCFKPLLKALEAYSMKKWGTEEHGVQFIFLICAVVAAAGGLLTFFFVKGSPLPKGHFTPRPKSGFVKMWRSTSLPLPKSLTSFHDCMGKLKSIVFKAQTSKNNRLDAGTLRPMDLSDNYLITTRQLPDKNLIITPDKEISQTLTNSIQGEIPTTCENKYVISKQVSEYTSTFTNPSTTYTDESSRVANQTIEEWHADYDAVWSAQCEDLF